MFILTLIFTIKRDIYIKKSSTFANLLIKKLGNWFAKVKMWKKKTPKEKNLKKDLNLYLKIQSGTVFNSCLCKLASWFLRKRNIDPRWVFPYNLFILFIYLLICFQFIYRWQLLLEYLNFIRIRLIFHKQQSLFATSGAISNIAECWYRWH